jgi:hypothetical protein
MKAKILDELIENLNALPEKDKIFGKKEAEMPEEMPVEMGEKAPVEGEEEAGSEDVKERFKMMMAEA